MVKLLITSVNERTPQNRVSDNTMHVTLNTKHSVVQM
jgi:hypothetical protein